MRCYFVPIWFSGHNTGLPTDFKLGHYQNYERSDQNRTSGYRDAREMKSVKRALLAACVMASLSAVYDIVSCLAFFRNQPVASLGICVWDVMTVGLIAFAIRALRKSN
jgi:hypothetical protein